MLSTTKVEIMSETNIQFVHASHLGTTVAVRQVEGGVVVGMSFSHKESPSGRTNFEQFSRRKGRSITTARVNAMDPKSDFSTLPYTIFVATDKDAKECTKAAGDLLHGIEHSVDNSYTLQLDNDELFDKIVNLI